MNDQTIKQWLGFAVRHKEIFCQLLDSFRAEDLENGLLSIPEALVNQQLSPLVLPAASPWIQSFHMSFSGNMIFIEASIDAKQAGPVQAMLMLSVQTFDFYPGNHLLRFQYREDVRSLGNPAQAIMLRMLAGDRGYLARLLSMNSQRLPGITADGTYLQVDLNDNPLFSKEFFQHVKVQYLTSGDGFLKLSFSFL